MINKIRKISIELKKKKNFFSVVFYNKAIIEKTRKSQSIFVEIHLYLEHRSKN